ncbi:hypothetical protein D3C79_711810 [compost metagenome]
MQGIERQLPAIDVGGEQPVRVVFVGTASQPAHVACLLHQPELGADAGQGGHVGSDLHPDIEAHGTMDIEAVLPARQQLEFLADEVAMADQDRALVRAHFQPEATVAQIVQSGLLPTGDPGVGVGMVRLAGADVVVERRPIEVIGDGLSQLLATLFVPAADATAGLVQSPFTA